MSKNIISEGMICNELDFQNLKYQDAYQIQCDLAISV